MRLEVIELTNCYQSQVLGPSAEFNIVKNKEFDFL